MLLSVWIQLVLRMYKDSSVELKPSHGTTIKVSFKRLDIKSSKIFQVNLILVLGIKQIISIKQCVDVLKISLKLISFLTHQTYINLFKDFENFGIY